MTQWIPLSPRNLNRNNVQKVNGIEIAVGMSPYDLPEAVRGFYNDRGDLFVIEFRYLDGTDEPRVPHTFGDIELLAGQHSGRLRQIMVKAKSIGRGSVALTLLVPRVEGAIDQLEASRPNRASNYGVAKDVIEQNKARLFGELVGA